MDQPVVDVVLHTVTMNVSNSELSYLMFICTILLARLASSVTDLGTGRRGVFGTFMRSRTAVIVGNLFTQNDVMTS